MKMQIRAYRSFFNRSAIEWFLLCLYASVLSLSSIFDIGFGRQTLSFYAGFILVSVFFTRPRFYLFPFLVCLVFSFPAFLDILTGRFIVIRDLVFIFNLTVFYCLCVFFIEMSGRRFIYALVIFSLSGLFFNYLEFFSINEVQGRFSGINKNPNDVASLGLVIFVLSYFIFTFASGYRVAENEIKVIKFTIPLIIVLSIYLITMTGTRFALLGLIILSFLYVMSLFVFVKRNNRDRYLLSISIMSLIMSLILVSGCFGSSIASERFSFLYNASGNENKIFADADSGKAYDIGKVDGSISSLGGRMPVWRLAYVMADEPSDVFFGVGLSEFDANRNKLQLPSLHNYFIESFVSSGIVGVLPLLALVVFVICVLTVSIFKGYLDTWYLLFFTVLLIMSFVNIWYLKPFWFLLAVLVSYSAYDFSKFIKGKFS